MPKEIPLSYHKIIDRLAGHNYGEVPDDHAQMVLNLGHQVADQFPELVQKYKHWIPAIGWTAAVVISMSTRAINLPPFRGRKPDQILSEITPEEIESRQKPPEKIERKPTSHHH